MAQSVPPGAGPRRPATVADWEAVPAPFTAHLIDGELYAMSRPMARHAEALGGIYTQGPMGPRKNSSKSGSDTDDKNKQKQKNKPRDTSTGDGWGSGKHPKMFGIQTAAIGAVTSSAGSSRVGQSSMGLPVGVVDASLRRR